MALDFNVLAGGEAGQGVQSVGLILSRTFTRGGYHIFTDQDFESRIRGGHSFCRVRVRETEVQAISEQLNLVVALNRETVDLHRAELVEDGLMLLDGNGPDGADKNIFQVPMSISPKKKPGI